MRRRLALSSARAAGTLVRWGVHRMLPGLIGAALVSAGAGEVAQHVFGHGLALWVGLAIAGSFVLMFAAELNRTPRRPPVDQ